MKIRSPVVKFQLLVLSFGALLPVVCVCAVTDTESADDSLKLLPPYGEMPPTFWEQHGTSLIVTTIVAVAVVALLVWWWLRPKPVVIVPPEVQARQALNAFLGRPEDGVLLSNVSQILRRYIISAFELPPGEPTTTEFCQTLVRDEKFGSELSTALADFLRRCDERKFSPQGAPEPMGAASRALELVALGEARRAQLRQLAATQAQQLSPAHA